VNDEKKSFARICLSKITKQVSQNKRSAGRDWTWGVWSAKQFCLRNRDFRCHETGLV